MTTRRPGHSPSRWSTGSEQSLGADHPYTLACQINQANELYDLGEYAAALRLDEDVNTRISRVLGPEHPDTLAAANNLAISKRINGDRAGASELAQRTLVQTVRVLGEAHPNAVAVRSATRLNCDIDPPLI